MFVVFTHLVLRWHFLMSNSSLRLTPFEIESLKNLFKMFFAKEDHLWIFGSRTDPQKKGGDIDLYVETSISDVREINQAKISFLTELYYKIGEQKIDVVIHRISSSFSLPIYEIAREEGFQLV